MTASMDGVDFDGWSGLRWTEWKSMDGVDVTSSNESEFPGQFRYVFDQSVRVPSTHRTRVLQGNL